MAGIKQIWINIIGTILKLGTCWFVTDSQLHTKDKMFPELTGKILQHILRCRKSLLNLSNVHLSKLSFSIYPFLCFLGGFVSVLKASIQRGPLKRVTMGSSGHWQHKSHFQWVCKKLSKMLILVVCSNYFPGSHIFTFVGARGEIYIHGRAAV